MNYLDCAQYDCCHNKAGCCCLNSIQVRHTGPGDAVCSSYRNSEGCGNVATDNPPASPETDTRYAFHAKHPCQVVIATTTRDTTDLYIQGFHLENRTCIIV